MAPEVMEGKLHSAKVDIYSFGLMMWEMWFGKRVFIELLIHIEHIELHIFWCPQISKGFVPWLDGF